MKPTTATVPVMKMIVYGKRKREKYAQMKHIKNMPTGWNAKCNCTKRKKEERKKNTKFQLYLSTRMLKYACKREYRSFEMKPKRRLPKEIERERETVCGELNLHRSSEIRAADWAQARVHHIGRPFNSSAYMHTNTHTHTTNLD